MICAVSLTIASSIFSSVSLKAISAGLYRAGSSTGVGSVHYFRKECPLNSGYLYLVLSLGLKFFYNN